MVTASCSSILHCIIYVDVIAEASMALVLLLSSVLYGWFGGVVWIVKQSPHTRPSGI